MSKEEYKRRLEQWTQEQRRREVERPKEKPYVLSEMPVRIPWGCLFIIVAFLLGIIYMMGAAAGFWRNILF